jgi:hypothetical protein
MKKFLKVFCLPLHVSASGSREDLNAWNVKGQNHVNQSSWQIGLEVIESRLDVLSEVGGGLSALKTKTKNVKIKPQNYIFILMLLNDFCQTKSKMPKNTSIYMLIRKLALFFERILKKYITT